MGKVGPIRPSLGNLAKNWPTPTATERSGRNPETGAGEGLSFQATKNWPRNPSHPDQTQDQKPTRPVLNPRFVAWLMGFPIGWECSEPLEMASYQQWRRLHGMFYMTESTTADEAAQRVLYLNGGNPPQDEKEDD